MVNKAFKCNEGEHGFTHTFNVKEEDGTAADVSWATGYRLVIFDNGVSKLDITTNLTSNGNDKVDWAIQNGDTDFSGDNLDVVLHFTASGRLEKTYDFLGIITKKKV